MDDHGAAAFLEQAHRNNWHQYLASLEPGARRTWDDCILTASDERQADMYRRQLDWRREAGVLPPHTSFAVMADPQGQRIGSGGATLRALASLPSLSSTLPPNGAAPELRILLIHSGGESRRLPHCSAIGKLFARVPRKLPDGRASTLFDEFLISVSGLAAELPLGVLVAPGDSLPIFDHLQLSFHRDGVIGVAVSAPAEMGFRHGVYVRAEGSHRLKAYLHKPSLEALAHWEAVSSEDTVDLDTGLVWLDASSSRKLVALARAEPMAAICGLTSEGPPGRAVALNLYPDLLLPLAPSTTLGSYLADTSDGLVSPEVEAARRTLWERWRGTPFSVERLHPAVFVHFGTSQEYWRNVAADRGIARMCGWEGRVAAWLAKPVQGDEDRLILIDAVLEGEVEVGSKPGLVVDSYLAGPLCWQGSVVVAGVQSAQRLTLGTDLVLYQVPVMDGFVSPVFGLHDDPKREWTDPSATFLNRPWSEWLAEMSAEVEVLWPHVSPEQRTLWNARLYPVTEDRDGSLALSLPLQAPKNEPPEWRARWQAAARISMADSFSQADTERLFTELTVLEDAVAARRFFAAIAAEEPAAEVRELLGVAKHAVERRSQHVAALLDGAEPIVKLRGYKALAVATADGSWEDRAFATLSGLIEEAVRDRWSRVTSEDHDRRRPPEVGRTVRVETAARIDFCSGWSDTPPHSIERGGTVLNAAITLRGECPIVAEGAWLKEHKLILESQDIEAVLEPMILGELLDYANPADPFALHKAALVMRGIVPAEGPPDMPLTQVLRRWGFGLRLSTRTDIPRGSGLGASSIMAGAVLVCLSELVCEQWTQPQLFDEVLCLEQKLTTGGGWQDQVGGLLGGIKLITTQPGLPQEIHVEPVVLPPETGTDLAARLLLVYTGQQRLAKNLLRMVMGRWMARDREVVRILLENGRLAVLMRDALEAGDVDGFGGLLAEHWALIKQMDPGSSNAFIEDLFEVMGPYISGGRVAGAGGGGFALVVARDPAAAQELAKVLNARYGDTGVALWPCAIPSEAMGVSAT